MKAAAPKADLNSPQTIDVLLAKLEPGNLVFNVPEKIGLKESYVAQLLVSPTASTDELKQLLAQPAKVEASAVRIVSLMEAILTGDEGLQVTALAPAEQAVSQLEPTEWRWSIQPRVAGRHQLHLSLNAVLQINDQQHRRLFRTFDRLIQVEVPPHELLWPALGAAGLALAGGGVWWWRRRLRSLPPEVRSRLAATQPQVFISYTRRDTERVMSVVSRLAQHGFRLWMDTKGIDGATQWAEEITKAIRDCQAVLLFASTAAFASKYVPQEIALAAEEQKPILPFFLEAAEPPSSLRLHLAGIQRLQLQVGAEDHAVTEIVQALHRLGVRPNGVPEHPLTGP